MIARRNAVIPCVYPTPHAHLRLITPANHTDDVVRLIERTVGTTHLVVLTGATATRQGDVVTCDVAREAGDELISGLREMELDRTGSIAVENIDLSLSKRADKAEDGAGRERGRGAVGAPGRRDARGSTLSVTYVAFLTLATMIAACGVVLDNAILIVGAMAVGPEFGPLAGICTALVQRVPRLAWRSVNALLVGFAVALVVTVGFTYLMDAVGLFSAVRLDAERPDTNFIYRPDASRSSSRSWPAWPAPSR